MGCPLDLDPDELAQMQRLWNRQDVGVVGRVAATRRDLVAVRPAGSGGSGAAGLAVGAQEPVEGRRQGA